jgi:deazaflavin-dependent oxidoreductase (nitroreductase family)
VTRLTSPLHRLARLIFAAPLWLYRLHLGWLLGRRFAQLTHRGRRTGRIRQTVVEVLRFDAHTHEVVVASGWGGRTDWYRNIRASPALEVRVCKVAYRPAQRFLTTEQLTGEVDRYRRQHRWAARALFPWLFGLSVNAPESELRARIDATLRGVAFRPQTPRSPV